MQPIEQMKKRLFVHPLHRTRDVPVALGQFFLRLARRPEQLGQARRIQRAEGWLAAFPLVLDFLPVMAKAIQVQPERPVFLSFTICRISSMKRGLP